MNSPVSARTNIYRIVLDALLVAIYVVLGTFLSIKIPGVIQISISSVPVLLCAFLFRPADAIAVAVVGNFLEQVIDPSPYGFATLLIWLIPGAVQALVASLGVRGVRKCHSKRMAAILTILTIVCAEFILTLLNAGLQYLDGYLLGYHVKAVSLLLPPRLLNGLVRCVISCVLIPLLVPPLKKVLARLNR